MRLSLSSSSRISFSLDYMIRCIRTPHSGTPSPGSSPLVPSLTNSPFYRFEKYLRTSQASSCSAAWYHAPPRSRNATSETRHTSLPEDFHTPRTRPEVHDSAPHKSYTSQSHREWTQAFPTNYRLHSTEPCPWHLLPWSEFPKERSRTVLRSTSDESGIKILIPPLLHSRACTSTDRSCDTWRRWAFPPTVSRRCKKAFPGYHISHLRSYILQVKVETLWIA